MNTPFDTELTYGEKLVLRSTLWKRIQDVQQTVDTDDELPELDDELCELIALRDKLTRLL